MNDFVGCDFGIGFHKDMLKETDYIMKVLRNQFLKKYDVYVEKDDTGYVKVKAYMKKEKYNGK